MYQPARQRHAKVGRGGGRGKRRAKCFLFQRNKHLAGDTSPRPRVTVAAEQEPPRGHVVPERLSAAMLRSNFSQHQSRQTIRRLTAPVDCLLLWSKQGRNQGWQSGNPGTAPLLWQTVRDEYRRLVMRRRAEAAAGQSHSLYKW